MDDPSVADFPHLVLELIVNKITAVTAWPGK
jgi:hypothetical protein